MENKMTMKEFKEKYDKAVKKILSDPFKGLEEKKTGANLQMAIMLSGIILFRQLEKELFKEEKIK